mmetsp:Transcript_7992/g.18028  ORF Transcript_7992/g.18028 Transcript_7992/m.18028 type:complete len:263 (+) Transcript_7992:107-895(+)|eukprot:CAMPEP_0172302982 /NCGR_PEP_ID=MMETSP1058-20130122/4603_1 /TAXON_ID=83371 /ORGANISM="Detonula confervacea, Strain CCMP 353" /LENGTH=262 /DNA_ID=CAMNT_0013013657 /DNA_START=51 /DNA_END=839 /DNA_ORIENTATION=-
MILSSCILSLRSRSTAAANALVVRTRRHGGLARSISHANARSSAPTALPFASASILLAATLLCTTDNNTSTVECSAVPLGGEPVMLSPSKEPATGILFPRLCNGMTLAGCGVRVKWGFVKVYAVGTYVDNLAMSLIKSGEAEVKKALLDPSYPRTIRIVMNRNLSIDKYTAAIIEALEPRMKGEDLGSLDEFKKLNPPVDLIQGAEMEMTIRGDTLLYKNAVGGLGQIRSAVFTKAMCDVFYGEDCVSQPHLDSVVSGVKSL